MERSVVRITALLAIVFVVGSWLAPALYAPVCHQQPDRCLQLSGVTQAVCARCTGLYLGAAAGLIACGWLLTAWDRRLSWRWLAVAFLPSLIDFMLPKVGLPGLDNLPRLLLALPAGFVAARLLARGLVDVVEELRG